MNEREDAGESITRVIEDIAQQSDANPIGFAVAIGMRLTQSGAMSHQANETMRDFAERVSRILGLPIGKLPTTSARNLPPVLKLFESATLPTRRARGS